MWWRARARVIVAKVTLRQPVGTPEGFFPLLEEEPRYQTGSLLVQGPLGCLRLQRSLYKDPGWIKMHDQLDSWVSTYLVGGIAELGKGGT